MLLLAHFEKVQQIFKSYEDTCMNYRMSKIQYIRRFYNFFQKDA